ncbi:MAG: hypothetical protein ACT6QU_02335 [Aliihoeflea sp.]|uniref:hypothetical protein n=1 Tax=Aliihoeflea sp. TaxID=2608088 RepID=UPI004033B4B4
MFLEKFSRFFRQYDITVAPRHKDAAFLPLNHDDRNYSIRDALQKRVDDETALEVQSNGDIVELMSVKYRPADRALVLLFHRASPDAAEPTYRTKARSQASAGNAAGARIVTVRTSTKAANEEQSVSAHLVIREPAIRRGTYRAVLEEIPGISMGVIRQIMGRALAEYTYPFKKGKTEKESYSFVKAEGLKSETMEKALEDGQIDFVTLTRPAVAPFADADGMFEPTNETMRLRVKQVVTAENFKARISSLLTRAKDAGWHQFNVDISFSDKRKRTVRLEKEQEAREILFVRSDQVDFPLPLAACAVDIVDQVVEKAVAIKAGG